MYIELPSHSLLPQGGPFLRFGKSLKCGEGGSSGGISHKTVYDREKITPLPNEKRVFSFGSGSHF